jgi:endonuclease/exonuclease/phosphatase family metal-dependent hydrolase
MDEYYIAWWNLENLFDVENSSQRPDWLQKELKKELKGWNQGVLDRKIQQLSGIISQMNGGNGPDLLGVCEVENNPVLEQVVDSLDPLGRAYEIAHHDCKDLRGIDVAFIYDSDSFKSKEQFCHIVLKRTATRDLFQVNFTLKESDRDLVVVGNHWPSRDNRVYYTEPYRIIAAETLSYWNKRIQEIKGKDTPTLVMGDFNDEPSSRSLTQYALSTNCKSRVETCRNPRMYNLMWPLMGKGMGTHYYNNFPGMLDQFLISRGFVQADSPLHVVFDSVKIERFPEMMTGEAPRRFGRPSKKYDPDGFSDHYPISMKMTEM